MPSPSMPPTFFHTHSHLRIHPSHCFVCVSAFVFAGRFRPYPLSRIYTVDCPPYILYSNFCLPASPIMNQPTICSFIHEQLSHSHCHYHGHRHRASMPISTPFTTNTEKPNRRFFLILLRYCVRALLFSRHLFFPRFGVHVFAFAFICASFARFFKVFHFLFVTCNAIHTLYSVYTVRIYVQCSHRRIGRGRIKEEEEEKKTKTSKIYGVLPLSLLRF